MARPQSRLHLFRSVLPAFALVAPLLIAAPAHSIDCGVPSASYPTIQSAADDVSCDRILLGPGVYAETADLTRSLQLVGAGAHLTTIEAPVAASVLDIDGGAPTNVVVRDLTVRGGSSFGGGVDIGGGAPHTVTLERVHVRENTDRGISVEQGGTLVMRDSAITDNTDGAGLVFDGGSAIELTNVTISGNRNDGDGGGIFVGTNGSGTLTNVTVSAHTANADNAGSGDGGGIAVSALAGTLTLTNTIVAGNEALGGGSPDCDGGPSSGGHNLIGDPTGCGFTPGVGDISGVDALLGPLADNGGPTPTHALLSGSPAIDAAGPGAPAIDQRGVATPTSGPTSSRGAWVW